MFKLQVIIIIICKVLNSRTGSLQKHSAEENSTGFEFGVFLRQMLYQANETTTSEFEIRVYHLLDSCLTRLMRLSPQDLKIRVYHLLDSCLTRLITPEFIIRVFHLLDSSLTRLMRLSPQDLKSEYTIS